MENENRNNETRSFRYLEENLEAVRRGIREAELRAGREAGETLLLAAVKSADTEEIRYLTRTLGVKDIGENRVQQLLSRYEDVKGDGVRIHFIGSLQKNKVKYIVDKVAMIHSVDSLSLAEEIDKRSRAKGITMDVLVEINSGREENKGGILPEDAPAFCEALVRYGNLRLVGFMTMAPNCEDFSEYHGYFAATRALALRIFRENLHRSEPPVLSMGMSRSFIPATEEGATVVRVGRQLFHRPEADGSHENES